MFVRFVTMEIDPATGHAAGLFHAAYELLRSNRVDAQLAQEVQDLLDWFEAHLPAPSQFSRSASQDGKKRGVQDAICWYKPDANQMITKMWGLVSVLREQGIQVTKLTTERPGYVTYEDAYQIVAVPFRDTWP